MTAEINVFLVFAEKLSENINCPGPHRGNLQPRLRTYCFSPLGLVCFTRRFKGLSTLVNIQTQ